MAIFPEYYQYDGVGLAELVSTKQISPAELVEEAIRRIETYNPKLNAVIYKMYDQAHSAAIGNLPDGPFRGVPFLLKDFFSTCAGVPTSDGNRLLQHIPALQDSEIIRRFKAAGVIILGKTNTAEFGLTPYVETKALGVGRNPWNLNCTPGGSSGGSAAAVAAGMVPLASGTDGAGSIRMPASCCGVFGLKPTRGRTPTGPEQGEIWHGLGVEHVITRSVRDSAVMLDAIAGAEVGAPYPTPAPVRPFSQEVVTQPGRLRIAFTSHPFWGHAVHADCVTGLHTTAGLLQELGHELVEDAPQINREAFIAAFMTMVVAEARADIERAAARAKRKPAFKDFDDTTYVFGLMGQALSASDYANAARFLQTVARDVGKFFEQYDVLLTPTLAMPPARIGELQPSGVTLVVSRLLNGLEAGWLLKLINAKSLMVQMIEKARAFDFMPYTALSNVTGQPAMSVPLYWNAAGLPVGMQFVGRFGDEAKLFRLAGQLEQSQPWFNRVPPTFN